MRDTACSRGLEVGTGSPSNKIRPDQGGRGPSRAPHESEGNTNVFQAIRVAIRRSVHGRAGRAGVVRWAPWQRKRKGSKARGGVMTRRGGLLRRLQRWPGQRGLATQRSCVEGALRCPTMRALLVLAALAFAPAVASAQVPPPDERAAAQALADEADRATEEDADDISRDLESRRCRRELFRIPARRQDELRALVLAEELRH